MKLDHPKPDTERFCTICNGVTTWHYDWGIGHSRCIVCRSTSKHSKNPSYVPKTKKEPDDQKHIKCLFRYLRLIETKPWLMEWG